MAVAHMLLLLIYQVLRTGKPYQDKQSPPLDERHKEKIIRHHVRRLGKSGIAVYSTRPALTGSGGRPPKAMVLNPVPAS